MNFSPHALRQRLVDLSSQRYRSAGRFAYYFARGKLGGDPVFLGLLKRGLIPDQARILDLGCGQGLLAAWLLATRHCYAAGEWPAGWPAPGQPADIRGVDLLHSDIRRAQTALGAPARFEQGDMRHVDFGQADVVVIMDVLHYVDTPDQDEVLRRVRAALPPGGLFLTRVGDASGGLRFRLSNWVDRTVAFFRGNRLPPLHCRPLSDWIQSLEALGFSVETTPMSGDLPFANVMLVARLD
ncbi:MAG: class I SAM-dependent methyltransferase [Gammaproteobacteria bacterium]|nr:class I SAM-dependent methyltransferase [Gammaproteobacteria bacterium]